jgi:hypothetical protein
LELKGLLVLGIGGCSWSWSVCRAVWCVREEVWKIWVEGGGCGTETDDDLPP